MSKNKIIVLENNCQLIIKCKGAEYIALFDKRFFDKVSKYSWCLSCGYPMTKIKEKTVRLHQLILGSKQSMEIDHRNTNKLDNRLNNLRFVTKSQNQQNRKVKGVCWDKINKKWRAFIMINYKAINLGSFKNKLQAIQRRKEGEVKYFI